MTHPKEAIEAVPEALAAAYVQGAMDVHNNYQADRSPDFTEAAMDYVAALTLPPVAPAQVTLAEAAAVLLDACPNPLFDQLKPVLMGEFKQTVVHGTDENGNELSSNLYIDWTTTKEIIRAALRAIAGGDAT